MTTPFHSPYVSNAIAKINDDLAGIAIPAASLGMPVYDRKPARTSEKANLLT